MTEDLVIHVVGNKLDLANTHRAVPLRRTQEYVARALGSDCHTHEVSAKEDDGEYKGFQFTAFRIPNYFCVKAQLKNYFYKLRKHWLDVNLTLKGNDTSNKQTQFWFKRPQPRVHHAVVSDCLHLLHTTIFCIVSLLGIVFRWGENISHFLYFEKWAAQFLRYDTYLYQHNIIKVAICAPNCALIVNHAVIVGHQLHSSTARTKSCWRFRI